ncbi:MAG: hypothetical protein R6X02_33115 [Enhygromyxa sp.]
MGPGRESIGSLGIVLALALLNCRPTPTGDPTQNPTPAVFVEAQAVAEPQDFMVLKQAFFDVSIGAYTFASLEGSSQLRVTKAPADADSTRMAMLHDGDMARLYLFKAGSDDTIYQFGLNPAAEAFEFGYRSIPELRLSGAPADASAESFAMLHDGATYRLYLRSKTRETLLYQFAYNPASQRYEFGHNYSILTLELVGSPADVDHRRWAMLHDGQDYRYYARVRGRPSQLYQFAFNRATEHYEFGFNSIPTLTVIGGARDDDGRDFAMLHDGARYRLHVAR